MEGIYNICRGGDVVGSAKVSREGLYYCFECHCRLEGREICKVYAACEAENILLGTPIPEGDLFRLRKRIPIRHFAGESMRIYIGDTMEQKSENFVPVKENEPFYHLEDLENAVFQVRDGISGIMIRK